MTKLNNTSKLVILAVVVVVAIVLIVVYGGSQSNNGVADSGTSASSTTASSTGTAGTPTSTVAGSNKPTGGTVKPSPAPAAPSPKPAPAPTPVAPLVTLVTPVPGETWKIATPNPIQWSKETGSTGVIELLDASTNALVGVILPQTGPHQTSYSWNTRDLLLSRTSPTKFNVLPGRYIVKIVFDATGVASITSQPINVSN